MKVLIIAPSKSSFIEKDHHILSELHDTKLTVSWAIRDILKACLSVPKFDVCLFWFASIRFVPIFLMAKLLGKKIFTIAGGYDVSIIPELQYGGLRKGGLSPLLRKMLLKYADKVITVSDSNSMEARENAGIPDTQIKRIYLGFDRPELNLIPWRERKNQVVFIACCDQTSMKIKGFDTFLELAKRHPAISFIHIGRISVMEFKTETEKLPNVTCLGYVKNLSGEFSNILNQSKVILLPSMIESFGASVIEGGLHGCIPLVSKNFALPEVVGEKGETCGTINDYSIAIEKIMKSEVQVTEIQSYYQKRFKSELRKESFRQLFNS
jgi:glycosyltransferase involved in cell wall biosynthesis